jgi:hypothetical protein
MSWCYQHGSGCRQASVLTAGASGHLFSAQVFGLEQYGLALVVERLSEQWEFGTTGIGVDSPASIFSARG